MKYASAIVVAVGLATAPAAFAKPVKMSDSQLDNVTGGALINAVVVDVVDIENNRVAVAIPVNAAAAINVLGGATGAAALQRPGRISQP